MYPPSARADVIEQLDTQLKSLERQAAQARRYRTIAEESYNFV